MKPIEKKIRESALSDASFQGDFSKVVEKANKSTSVENLSSASVILRKRRKVTGIVLASVIGCVVVASSIVTPILVSDYYLHHIARFGAAPGHEIYYTVYKCTFGELLDVDENGNLIYIPESDVAAGVVSASIVSENPHLEKGVIELKENLYACLKGSIFEDCQFLDFEGEFFFDGRMIWQDVEFFCEFDFFSSSTDADIQLTFINEDTLTGGMFSFKYDIA